MNAFKENIPGLFQQADEAGAASRLAVQPARAPVAVGETVSTTVHFSLADIAAFATACHDRNPLHRDSDAAAHSRFGEVIASCSHAPSMLMGLSASYFSRSDDGIQREMVGLNYNFSFKAPVFADEDIQLSWRVATVEWHARLGGHLAQIEGTASTARSGTALIARGTILVKTLD
ncbi:MAG: MaoC family dehydratase N-terminal domain-containing protein [Aquabacterium sp.]|nr:MaoC family dehydratase N-terminal domain-containing protein [Aquabacterium sp.]